jgi:hypothetical protein
MKTEEIKAPTHDGIQQKVYEYIWNNYPQARRCFWHTPNELTPDTFVQMAVKAELAKDTKKFLPQWIKNILFSWQQNFVIKLSKRKSIGVLAGVTDLVLYWKGTLYMMDIKIGRDCLSEAQIKFIAANVAQGGVFMEIGSVEQGQIFVDSIFRAA